MSSILSSFFLATVLGARLVHAAEPESAAAPPVRDQEAASAPATASVAPRAPEYARDIAPIIARSCSECHRPGGVAPFALATHEDLIRRAKTIRAVVADGLMPPWGAAMPEGSAHRFANDRSLGAEEKRTLLAWLDSDTRLLGDVSKLPPPPPPAPEWSIGPPDAVFELPREVEIRASGQMPYVNLRVPTGFTEDRWIRAWEVVPGARDVVHHVLVFAVPAGARGRADEARGFFAAYVPGNGAKRYGAEHAKRLPAGSDLLFQLHYTPNGKATVDRTRLGLVFADAPPKHEVRTAGIFDPRIEIAPGAASHREGTEITVPADLRILAWMPHMHARGKSFRAYRESGETREVLLEVPRYDFNWQFAYEYAQPVELKRGSTLGIEAVFDNSAENAANPDPSKRVRWGQQTSDEMLIGYVEYELVDPKGPDLSSRALPRDPAAQFALLDRNRNGVIDRGEGGVLVERAFERADADGDGRVTRAEFEAFVSRRNRRN